MKTIRVATILLFFIAVAFTGCNTGPDKLIEKTWKVTDVFAKGTISDSIFQIQKASLMKVQMSFDNNKYTMASDGQILESGTYSFENNRLLVKTKEGMTMDAAVTKEKLTLDTPDFTVTLQPK